MYKELTKTSAFADNLNVAGWWASQAQRMRLLSGNALTLLQLPAVGTSADSVLSVENATFTSRRSSLTTRHFMETLVLKCNGDLSSDTHSGFCAGVMRKEGFGDFPDKAGEVASPAPRRPNEAAAAAAGV